MRVRVLKKLAGALLTVWIVITISFAMAHFEWHIGRH